MLLDGKLAKQPSGVERESRNQMHEAEPEVEPDGRAQKVAGGDQGVRQQENAGAAALEQACDQPGQEEVGKRADKREGDGEPGFAGLGFRFDGGLEAADGQQQDGAYLDSVEHGEQGASSLAMANRSRNHSMAPRQPPRPTLPE